MSLAVLSISLALSLSPVARAQTILTNGDDQAGTLLVNTTNSYSFHANAGDSINLRMGATGFGGYLRLYGPDGSLLTTGGNGSPDSPLAYTATNSGTFTVLVSSYYVDETGTYVLHLAQMPEPFIVPAGDEGGPMTNGGNYAGTNTLGDLDMWTFTANAGDSINLRMGATGFDGYLRLYGPNGALLTTGGNGSPDSLLAYTATNSGTFTVLVSSYYGDDTGTYVLHLAQMPEPFIVPAGDEGGALTDSPNYTGTISLGDLDIWAFTACQGEPINLRLNTTNFDGKLQLYGQNGALLKTAQGSTSVSIAYTATNCGPFTVLVSSYFINDSGTYGLTAEGLANELKICPPIISGSSLTVNGVGGPTNAVFVLYTTTNLDTPLALWTPILTNQFNQFGVFGYTSGYNPAQRQQFYRFRVP